MSKGHVYAARVPGEPEVKIGKTTRPLDKRLSEHNNSAVLRDYEYEFLLPVNDPSAVEKEAHRLLKDVRVRKDREFFCCSPREAKKKIKKAAATVDKRSTGSLLKRLLLNPLRSLVRLLFGTALTISGLLVSLAVLSILYIDPVARTDYAEWMLAFLVGSGILLLSGFRLIRRRR